MATEIGYRKGPLDDEWQPILLLTLDQIEKEIDIKSEGLKDGLNNHPESEASDWSLCEKQIVQLAERHVEVVRTQAHEDKVLSHNDLEQMYQSSISNELKQIEQEAKQEFEKKFVVAKSELSELQEEELRQLRNLNFFKESNNLVRDAVYPSSRLLHFGVLSLFFLIECIGNMYFFAEGSDIGLLGGFFQAALVSTVNVGLSYIVGLFALTQLSHNSVFRNMAGWIFAAAYLIVITLFHFAVAHYRDLLATDPDQAMYMAIDKLRNDMLGLETLDSILVLILGIAIAVVALYEGYKHDDPYPGFGAKDRRYQKARAVSKKKAEELQASLVAVLDEAVKKIGELIEERERVIGTYHKYCELLDVKSERYNDALDNADKVANIALNKYRKSNGDIRTDSDPAYFLDELQIYQDYSLPDDFFSKEKYVAKGEQMKEDQQTFLTESDNVVDRMLKKIEAIDQRVNRLVTNAAKAARKTLDSEREETH